MTRCGSALKRRRGWRAASRGRACAAHRLGRAEMGERIGALRPLRAPQAFAAGHGGFFVDMVLRAARRGSG